MDTQEHSDDPRRVCLPSKGALLLRALSDGDTRIYIKLQDLGKDSTELLEFYKVGLPPFDLSRRGGALLLTCSEPGNPNKRKNLQLINDTIVDESGRTPKTYSVIMPRWLHD